MRCIQATCGTRYLFSSVNSTIRQTINRGEQQRKSGPGKYFLAEPPGTAGKGVAKDSEPAEERLTPAGRQALAVETAAPMAEEMPLVLAVEPQAPAWAHHTVRFLQTGELPDEQEEAEKVALRSDIYQFIDDV